MATINKFKIGKHILLLLETVNGRYSLRYEGETNQVQHQCTEREVFNILEEELRAASGLSEMEMKVYLLMKAGTIKTAEIARKTGRSPSYIESIRGRITRKSELSGKL